MKTTIHTLKKEYKDNQTYLNEKQKLFQNLTYHMIEKELHHNDIDIKYEEVLNYYNDCKDTDETIAYFDEKYDQQLDRLGEKNEMFDDDALVYYIVKVIEHHEDIHQVPDKNYIASDIIDLIQKDHDYYDLLEQTQSIMKRKIKTYKIRLVLMVLIWNNFLHVFSKKLIMLNIKVLFLQKFIHF